jgi:hypothetical protein
LKGGAANEKGEVTLSQLVKYVQDTVPKRLAIDLGSTKQQRPFAMIEGYRADELVVAVTNSATNAANTSAPNVAMVDPAAIELSFWDSIKNSTNPDDFKAYLDKYPDGQFAALAKSRAQPSRPANNGVGDANSPEMIYWNAIKDSRNPADLRAYVTKFPSGLFVELANNRIASLDAEARERERARESAAEAERARNTHLFDVQDASRTPGTLTVAPGVLTFAPRKQKANNNVTVQCSEIKRVEQGQSAFVLGHVNVYLTAVNGKERQLMFYTVVPASGGLFTPVKPGSNITADVINAIIEACRMTRINK